MSSAITAKLAPHVNQVSDMLKFGIPALHYWNLPETNDLQHTLESHHSILTNAPNAPLDTKEQKEALQKQIKTILLSLDETSYYMLHLFADALSHSSQHTVTVTVTDIETTAVKVI